MLQTHATVISKSYRENSCNAHFKILQGKLMQRSFQNLTGKTHATLISNLTGKTHATLISNLTGKTHATRISKSYRENSGNAHIKILQGNKNMAQNKSSYFELFLTRNLVVAVVAVDVHHGVQNINGLVDVISQQCDDATGDVFEFVEDLRCAVPCL
jgi:hypothetical protein